jgi:hypothetical protein
LDKKAGDFPAGNFLNETRSFFEERCDCKKLIREANVEVRKQNGNYFWSEEVCDNPDNKR